ITASQNAWNSTDISENPPLEVRAKARCSVISPFATARDTVHCTDIAALMAPSICPHLTGTRRRYSTTKCTSETTKAAMIGSVRILSGMAMPANATIGTPIRFGIGPRTPRLSPRDRVQPAERECAPRIRQQPARAGQKAPPVFLDNLEPAIGPAVALLLEGLIGVRQQAVAVAVVGVVGQPAVLDDGEAKIGVLADGVAVPAAGQ